MSSTKENSCVIQVHVQPNAKHEGWAGLWNNTHYKIALRAPAVDGKANAALIQFLTHETGLSKSAFTILHGINNRNKVIQIIGINKLEPPANPCK